MGFSLQIDEELFFSIGVKLSQLHWNITGGNDINVFGGIFPTTGEAPSVPFRIAANICDCSGNILYTLHDVVEHTLDPIRYEVFHVFCADISRFLDVNALSHMELFPERV